MTCASPDLHLTCRMAPNALLGPMVPRARLPAADHVGGASWNSKIIRPAPSNIADIEGAGQQRSVLINTNGNGRRPTVGPHLSGALTDMCDDRLGSVAVTLPN